jgi:hypothetical protein
MGLSTRREDILAEWQRAAREREAVADAQVAINLFNSRLAAGRRPWFFQRRFTTIRA